jgi:hypothetical protein
MCPIKVLAKIRADRTLHQNQKNAKPLRRV